jgi:hypothetical protein
LAGGLAGLVLLVATVWLVATTAESPVVDEPVPTTTATTVTTSSMETQVTAISAALPSTPQSWSRVSFPDHARINAIVAGGPGLVAVGYMGDLDCSPQAGIWFSLDGTTWDSVPSSDLGPGVVHDVVQTGQGLVAVGIATGDPAPPQCDGGYRMPWASDAVVWTSPDGVTWRRTEDQVALTEARLEVVASQGSGLVAVGTDAQGPQAWFSTDGLSWDRAAMPAVPNVLFTDATDRAWPNMSVHDLESIDGRFIAVGTVWLGEGSGQTIAGGDTTEVEEFETEVMWTSLDGREWTAVSRDPEVFPPGSGVKALAAGSNASVAVGWSEDGQPASWTTQDGITWRRSPDQDAFLSDGENGLYYYIGGFRSVASGPSGFVAVGMERSETDVDEAAVWTSPDGQAWIRVPTAAVFEGSSDSSWAGMGDVSSWGQRFVAAGWAGKEFVAWLSSEE